MNNYVQPGGAVDVVYPDNFASGEGIQVGVGLFGVAPGTCSSGQTGPIWTEGVFDLAKTTGQAYAGGARLYWNSSTKKITTATGGMLGVGLALGTCGTLDTTARVKLWPVGNTLA